MRTVQCEKSTGCYGCSFVAKVENNESYVNHMFLHVGAQLEGALHQCQASLFPSVSLSHAVAIFCLAGQSTRL